MKQAASIRFNYIMNMICTVSGMIFPLLIYPHAARTLGESGIGAVSFVNSVISCFGILAQLGIPAYGVRACAKVREDKEKLTRVVHEILAVNLITCALTYLIYIAAVFLYPKFYAEKELFLLMGTVLFFNTIGVEWLYKGLEQYRYITCCALIFKAIGMVGVFLLVRTGSDYVIYGGLTVFALAGSGVVNFLNLRKYIFIRPVGNYRFRQHLKPVSVFLAMSVATTIYTNMDSVMLGIMKGTAENGYYDVAVKVKNILTSVVASLGTVLLPRMTFYISKNRQDEFQRITHKALRFIFLTAFPLCVYFMLFADITVNILTGDGFKASVLPMQIILSTLVLIGLTNIIGMQMMVPTGQEKKVLYSETAGAAANLMVNALLIPQLGCCGAAIGTLAAEATVFIAQVWMMRDQVIPVLRKLPYGKAAAALTAAAVMSLGIKTLHMGEQMTLMLSGGLFFITYGAVLIFTKEELVQEIWQQTARRVRNRYTNQ